MVNEYQVVVNDMYKTITKELKGIANDAYEVPEDYVLKVYNAFKAGLGKFLGAKLKDVPGVKMALKHFFPGYLKVFGEDLLSAPNEIDQNVNAMLYGKDSQFTPQVVQNELAEKDGELEDAIKAAEEAAR